MQISSEGASDNKTGAEVPMGRFFGLRPLNDVIPPGPLPSDPEGVRKYPYWVPEIPIWQSSRIFFYFWI